MGTMRRANGFRRFRITAGADRLRTNAWPVLQTALAASVAYFLAAIVLGQEQPFFAPIAAVISLGLTLGQRGRRTVELVFGVAIGLLVADLLVLAIGVGAVQVAIVVALAMAAALLFAERSLFVNQAAISAILVIVLQPPNAVFSPDRFLSALIGGGVALAINYAFPINPRRLVERAARPIFNELVAVLEEIAAASKEATLHGPSAHCSSPGRSMREWRCSTRPSSPAARPLGSPRLAAGPWSISISTLARASGWNSPSSTCASWLGAPPTRSGAAILRHCRRLCATLPERWGLWRRSSKYPARPMRPADMPLEAAWRATEILRERHDLAISVLIGQIRSAAVDLLRSTGMDQASALRALEEVAGRASEIGWDRPGKPPGSVAFVARGG